MARNLQVGTEVYIPLMKVNNIERPIALYRTTIVAKQNRSVQVNLPFGNVSDWISSGLVIDEDISILILTIGDLATEDTLLNPLSKSVLQFCRLLIDDDRILNIKCRSLDELDNIWTQKANAYKYVILIGHGSPTGITFCVDHSVEASYLMEFLNRPGFTSKHFISLCCQTGYQSFARDFSSSPICESFIAPFHSVHGAIASQFVQTYLSNRLLQGHSVKIAYNKSMEAVVGSSSFRFWKDGRLMER